MSPGTYKAENGDLFRVRLTATGYEVRDIRRGTSTFITDGSAR